jgi:hypothetical protein
VTVLSVASSTTRMDVACIDSGLMCTLRDMCLFLYWCSSFAEEGFCFVFVCVFSFP